MSLGTIKKRQEAAVRQSPFAKKLSARRKSLETTQKSHSKFKTKIARGRTAGARGSGRAEPREHAIVLNELYEAGWHPSQAYSPAATEEIRQLLLELAEANVRATRKAMKRRW